MIDRKKQLVIRLFDIVLSFIGLVISSPIFLIVSLILLLTGEHKVFYFQERVGKNGELFKIIKFVTMRNDSEKIGTKNITIKNDPRVLPVGKILRKTKINELPQLINVFKGDMSLVGPRPQTKDIFESFPEDLRNELTKVKPGITGIGPIIFRSEEEWLSSEESDPAKFYKEIISPYKSKVEKWYIDNYSIENYFKIILYTILIVFFPKLDLHWKIFKGIPEPPRELRKYLKRGI